MTRVGRILFAAALALAIALPAGAQVTTGNLGGVVVTQDDGSALPGASITAVHTPTGTIYTGDVGSDGRFIIPNVRVGGPYTITATLEGFTSASIPDAQVALGQTTEVRIPLGLASLEETVTVTAEFETLINPNKTGAATTVSTEALEQLPSIRRSLQDFARTNAYFSQDPSDASATRISVAGRNNRYNSIQIDGAVNNDIFGLADTGTPGGSADTQPISLDAVQELQLVVSPYDVRQGGFSGGAINAVTRSGSNQWQGSAYGSTRDESSVGDLDGRKVGEFKEEQYGARFGGRLIRDKAFFFLSGEANDNNTPTGFAADGSAPQNFADPALAAAVGDILRTRDGFDPGGLGQFSEATESSLIFGRLDWNLSQAHNLTLRHNFVDASKDRIESGNRNSATRFSYPSYYYLFSSETNSTVAQLNSTLGSSMFNEARIGWQTVRDNRDIPESFPDVVVRKSGTGSNEVDAGINRFSHRNSLDQDILEITDDVTLIHGAHSFNFGTHNEFYTFSNLFIEGAFGAWTFQNLAEFQAGVATGGYVVGFSNTGNDSVEFDVQQFGIYGGDQWRVNDKFSLTYGVRIDMPTFPDTPSRNPLVDSALGIDTSDVPSSMMLFQPRVGFNWAPGSEGRDQLRGGVGIFAGRTPYVWMSNNYANSGVEFSRLSVAAGTAVPWTPDSPPRSGVGARPQIDAIDPDFEFPQVMRATLGYDRKLFWGIEGTIELLYSDTVEDAYYTNENLTQTGVSGSDGRALYTRTSNAIDAVFFLRNTGKGSEMNESIRLRKLFDFGLDLTGQYVHGSADSVADLTSSRAVSNYRFSPHIDPALGEDARSFFEVEHRITMTATYNFDLGRVRNNLALYYNAQSGNPYTYIFANDVNADGADSNDLFYVPQADCSDILLSGMTCGQLNTFIESNDHLSSSRGSVVDRNGSRAPWVRQLDLHYGLELPISMVRAEVTFDVLNLLNLIDEDKGRFNIVPFNTYAPVRATVDTATRKWVYAPRSATSLNPGSEFSLNDLRSRSQYKLGLRVSF